MRDINFNITARLVELITIWMREDWSDDHKLFMMAKHNARTKISGEALALALLYFEKKCLHIQLSLENPSPKDVYHEAIQCDESTFRVSGMVQAALKLIAGKEWKEPYKKKRRQQYLLTPQYLSKVHTMLENTITVSLGAEETDANDVTNELVPRLENKATDDIQVAIGIAPMEHQTHEHERNGHAHTIYNLRRVVNVTLLPDAQPGEWDHPYRSLATRQQYLLTPQYLSKVHTMLENTITGIAYDIKDLPKIAINSDVLLIVGAEETDANNVTNELVPRLENKATDDIQVAIGIAPMEHQTHEHERNGHAHTSLWKRVVNVTLLPDAQPREWDHPYRSLATTPYDQNGVIGFYATTRWYDSIRKFWVPRWPPLTKKPQKEEETPPQRKRLHDDDDTVYPPWKSNPQKHCYRGKRLAPHHK
ncbi:hypothetical protein COOONC_00143 [Cooperia oncophora]